MRTTCCGLVLTIAVIAGVAGLAAPAQPLAAPHRVTSFISHIVVHSNSTMTVTETITYQSTVEKKGIIWEIGPFCQNRLGNLSRFGFKMLEVRRDGKEEPYRQKKPEGDREAHRLYIGREGVALPPGVSTYTLKYFISRQLAYFPKFDELYWSVPGNGWQVPIDLVEAQIELPPGAKILEYTAYTGSREKRGQSYSAQPGGHQASFKTTRPLEPGEALTVAVSWPKGVVWEPRSDWKLALFLRDNQKELVWWGLGLLGAYFFLVWRKMEWTPSRRTIVPLDHPPSGLSPAAMDFIMATRGKRVDSRTLSLAAIDMAVKGYLQIEGSYDGIIRTAVTLRQRSNFSGDLPGDEAMVASQLFLGRDSLDVAKVNKKALANALGVLQTMFKERDGQTAQPIFISYRIYLIPVVVLSVLTFLALCFLASQFSGEAVTWSILLLVASLTLSGLGFLFFRVPTWEGRQLLDQIEGFKLYLSGGSSEGGTLQSPQERTLEHFEKYLPYALALGVADSWSLQFADLLVHAGKDGGPYVPSWFSGYYYVDRFDIGEFLWCMGWIYEAFGTILGFRESAA